MGTIRDSRIRPSEGSIVLSTKGAILHRPLDMGPTEVFDISANARILARLHFTINCKGTTMSTTEVTLLQATRQMNKSMAILEDAFHSYNRDTLRRTLWLIAAGYVTYESLATELGVSPSQVSRSARTLHLRNYNGDDGLGLIDITFDLNNPRVKVVALSAAGRKLLAAEYKAITGNTIKGLL